MKQVPPHLFTQDEESTNQWRQRIVVAAILLLLPIVYFSPAIFADFTLVPGDGLSQNLGVRVLIGRMLRAGQLPLWNPYIFAGTPLLASIYPGALYPPNWVFALLSPAAAMNFVVITTYHIAIIGTYLYGRRIGMTRAGAIAAGMAFTFSGYMIAHMGHTSRIAAAVWLPWILLAIEHLYHRLTWRWVALGALFIALQLFAGEPQMNFYTVLVCGAYGLYSLVLREAGERRLRFLFGVAAMSICGLLLSMIQLLPERELLGLGERAKIAYDYFSGFSFPPANVLTFIFPFFFGGIYFGGEKFNVQYWGQSTIDETCGYFGLLTLLLALVALCGSARRSMARFWGVAALVSLALAFGGYLPFGLNAVLHQLPVYSLFRASGRHMFEFSFCMAMLAGLGVSYLTRAERERANRAARIGALLFIAIFAITALVFRFSGRWLEGGGLQRLDVNMTLLRPEAIFPAATAILGLIALWVFTRRRNALGASLLIAALFADLAAFGWMYNYAWKEFVSNVGAQIQDPPAVQFIKSRETDLNAFRFAGFLMEASGKNYRGLNSPNVSIVRGLQGVNGYDAMRLPRLGAIAGDMTIEGVVGDVNVAGAEHQGLNLLNVKYLLRERPSLNDPERMLEIDGVRFEKDGINLNFDPGGRADVTTHGAAATELVLVTAMGNAVHIADETPVVRVRLHARDGRVIEREIRAGRDTAEWAIGRAEVRAAIKHRLPKIAESWPVEGFQGHRFLARFPFDRAEIDRIEFEYLLKDAALQIVRASLFDRQTGLSTALDLARFNNARWRGLALFGDVEVFENLNAQPRAWFVRRAAVEWSADVLAAIKTGKLKDGSPFDPAQTVLFEREDFGNREIKLPEIAEPVNAEVKITRYEPNRIELQTRNGGAGFLVLSEIWYRGWEAWIDGRRAPVEKVNYALRGLAVPAGDHRIEFVFRAHSFRNGAAYSLLGVLLLLLGAGAGRSGAGRALAGKLERSALRTPSTIKAGLTRVQIAVDSVFRRVNVVWAVWAVWIGRIVGIAFVIGLLLYGNLLARKATYAVGGSDSSGYARIARSLLQGGIVQPVPELDALGLPDEFHTSFLPLAYTTGPRPRTTTPFYPVGFPLHLAAAALIGGWESAPFLVNPLLAVLSLILMCLTALELGLSRGFAMAGAVILGGGATFIFMSLAAPMSDVPATFWALAAVWGALRSRKRPAWALLAGAAFGMAFLIRPTGVLLLAPLAFALSQKMWKPKTPLYFLLGGAPMAAIFFAYNAAAYGHPLHTGYAAIGLQNAMALTGFAARFGSHAYWLAMTLSPLVVLGWLGVAVNGRVAWRDRALLIVWFGAFMLFYSCYNIYGAWWYTRFLLPGIPALILGALLTARDVAGRLRSVWWRRVALACLLLAVFGIERYYVKDFNVYSTGAIDAVHATSCRWADRTLPDRALVLSVQMSGALKFYTQRPIVRYDMPQPEQWTLLKQRARERQYKWFALMTPPELDEARKRVPGKWTQIGALEPMSLWQVEPEE